jgi:uncharacterized LabA/DUF88 family protein
MSVSTKIIEEKYRGKERIIAYIDGFNLYFGLKSKGWRRYYWLDLQKTVQNLLKSNQLLEYTKYFTARITGPHDKQKRQTTYIEALETLSNFQIFYGKYQHIPRTCRQCDFHEEVPIEKMTDVNIAVELLSDAFQDLYDAAYLISADSDLVPVIATLRSLFPKKRIVVAFPPGRYSRDLANKARFSMTIGRRTIAKSLFPSEIRKANGYILKCPELWKCDEQSS